MVPIAIGLVGVLLGAIALFMSISNGSSVTSKINDLSARVDDASTKATSASQGVQDLEGKVKLNADTITGINSSVQNFISQASSVIQKQGQEIADLTAKGPKASTASKGAKSASSESSGPGGTYTIASGDTFSKIAAKYGVSVAAIEAANAGVESSKLKIGQKINLPGKASSSAPAPAAPAPEATAPAASAP